MITAQLLIGSSKSLKWIFTANQYTCQDALEDGVIDFLINFKDESLTNLLHKLSLNKERLLNLSLSAKNFIFQNNSLDIYLKKEVSDYKF